MSVHTCPECGEIVYFNSYFGGLYCNYCGWREEASRKTQFERLFAELIDRHTPEELREMWKKAGGTLPDKTPPNE